MENCAKKCDRLLILQNNASGIDLKSGCEPFEDPVEENFHIFLHYFNLGVLYNVKESFQTQIFEHLALTWVPTFESFLNSWLKASTDN